jgi:hypothetical protein
LNDFSNSQGTIMKKHLLMLAIASSCLLGAQASNAMSKDEYKAAKDKIEADYKVDKAACDGMKDNAKDVCLKQAQGKENVAKAELDQQYEPSASHQRKVAEEKVDAQYAVAKEKCDDQKGAEKSACEKQAKADEAKGKADIKAMKM